MEMVGQIFAYSLVAFLIVKFLVAKNYYKKYNQKMGPVRFIIWLLVLAVILALAALSA